MERPLRTWSAAMMIGTAATPGGVILAWLLPRPLDAVVALPLVLLDLRVGRSPSPVARVGALVLGIALTWLLYVVVARLVLRRLG
jgi:hypothetical protein